MDSGISQYRLTVTPQSETRRDVTGSFLRCIGSNLKSFEVRFGDTDTWKYCSIGIEYRLTQPFTQFTVRNLSVSETLHATVIVGEGEVRDDRLHIIPQSPQDYIMFAPVRWMRTTDIFTLTPYGTDNDTYWLETNPGLEFYQCTFSVQHHSCAVELRRGADAPERIGVYFGGDAFDVWTDTDISVRNLSRANVRLRVDVVYYPEYVYFPL